MSEFKVKENKVRDAAAKQNELAGQMKRLEEEIRQVQYGLSFEIAEKERIWQRLRTVRNATSSQVKGISNAAKALNQIADTYEITEARLAGHTIVTAKLEPLTNSRDVLDMQNWFGPAADVIPFLLQPGKLIGVLIEEGVKIGTEKLKDVLKNKLEESVGLKEWNESLDSIKDKETWYSHNKKELKDSDIHTTKIIGKSWSASDSMMHGKEWYGNREGSYVSNTWDLFKQKASAELYGGLYYTDPETGQRKLRMAAGVSVGYTMSVLSMEQNARLGDEYLNAYVRTEETIGKVGINGSAVIGLRDADGNLNPTAHVNVSAEAIAAELSAKMGVNVLGADVGVKAGVNVGIGAHAEFGFKDGKFSADIGASLGIGGSVKLEVDIGGMVNTVSGAAKAAWTTFTGWF